VTIILLQLPVSPQVKQAIEEKEAGGHPPGPRQGLRPLHPRLKGDSKKPTRENTPAPPAMGLRPPAPSAITAAQASAWASNAGAKRSGWLTVA